MKRWAALFLLLMTAIPLARAADSEVFKSIHAVQDVALNTNPASAFWSGAIPVSLNADSMGKIVAGHPTVVRSRWTNDNIYFLFVCPYRELNLKPHPNTKAETNELWNWDVAEVFLGSDFKNIRRYKEFEISPQGEWVDLDINLDTPHHEDGWVWNSGIQVAARIDKEKNIWYGAMQIPMKAVASSMPRPGMVFRLNLYRTEGAVPGKKAWVWQPTMSDNFHVPEHFGKLLLVVQQAKAESSGY